MSNLLNILAAEKDGQRPKVRGDAYTGGKMSVPGFMWPVVVQLDGMDIPASIPLLVDHSNTTSSRIGEITAEAMQTKLKITGEIQAETEVARNVVEQSKSGARWQLSIGAKTTRVEYVPEKMSRRVNGKTFAGPFYHVMESQLREVSIVAVGADSDTTVNIAASLILDKENKGRSMDKEFLEWLEANSVEVNITDEGRIAELKAAFEAGEEPPAEKKEKHRIPAGKLEASKPESSVQAGAVVDVTAKISDATNKAIEAERQRVASIEDICAGGYAEIKAKAISQGWDEAQTSTAVLAAMRESRPNVPGIIVKDNDVDAKTLEASMCLRAGIGEDVVLKDYGEKVIEAADKDRSMSIQGLLRACASIEGKSISSRSFGNDDIRASFSTVSLPGILNNVANKAMLKSFKAQPVVATKLCTEGDIADFKESERYRLTDVGDLPPVGDNGELVHGSLSEDKATNQLETYGKIFALTRKMIINDDLGAFLRVPEGMGARGARKIDQLFFSRLQANPTMADGVALFNTANHKNYKAGATTALSGDSLAVAIQMFLDQVDSDGQPINIMPKFLLVPTALKFLAKELLNSSSFMATGSTDATRLPTYNAFADEGMVPVSSSSLTSDKAWYLFGDPASVDTFEIGYLKGKRTPTVEKGDTDFNTLGMQFRVYFDLGVREQDHRAVAKMKGEA